jgi:signal transduction histidine kinase
MVCAQSFWYDQELLPTKLRYDDCYGYSGPRMFKDLRAGTKFLILCGVSLALTSVATYALLVEKQIAINFARSELVGSKYLALLRPIYVAVLKTQTNGDLGERQDTFEHDPIDLLSRADVETAGILQIGNIVKALAATLHDLNANNSPGNAADDIFLSTLKNLHDLAARIGDDSNLTLDPVLDTYHIQNIVVMSLPTALEEIGQAQLLARAPKAANDSVNRKARLIALDTLLRANIDGIINDLGIAERGTADDRLKQFVEPAVTTFATNANAYLDALRAFIDAGGDNVRRPDSSYAGVVNSTLDAWEITQKQLEQSLIQRIDDLHHRRLLSLMLIGALGTLGLLVAFLTYRDMIVPIKQLADLANTIRETKNYGLRFRYQSRDEIGGLAAAFNEMLGELAVAREREIMSQAEIARVSRLTTMGAMVASIAHEIRQPLAALVANSHAGARWLEKEKPNLDEARAALKSIGEDGHRANEVITSISMMFKKNTNRRIPVDINEVVNDVLNLSRGELRSRKVTLHTKLASDLPSIPADPVQLREVLLNLIMNAAEAMNATDESLRALAIASMPATDSVAITVEDSGTGIDPKNAEQIFEAFFTTKPTGMGMGLAICRSIIAAHGGRLWASPGPSRGTVFHVVLPLDGGEPRSPHVPNI